MATATQGDNQESVETPKTLLETDKGRDLLVEEAPSSEKAAAQTPVAASQGAAEESDTQEEKGTLETLPQKPPPLRKLVLLLAIGALFLLTLAVCGALFITATGDAPDPVSQGEGGIRTQTEKLAPLIIPRPPGGENLAVKIELSVEWDDVTRASFERRAVDIRRRLYGYLEEAFRTDKELFGKGTLIQSELQRIVRQALAAETFKLHLENMTTLL
jgi:hypothetical protein